MLILSIWGVLMFLGLLSSIFWIVELIDVVRRQFRDDTTKVLWVVVVVVGHFVGSLVYYFVGKPTGTLPGERLRY
jgi:hypothetical protein